MTTAERTRPTGRLRLNSFTLVDGVLEPDEELLGFAVSITADQLDEHVPGWHSKITKPLWMESCRDCVLGQVFDDVAPKNSFGVAGFGAGMEFLRDNDVLVQPFVFTHHKAIPFWEAEIARRAA